MSARELHQELGKLVRELIRRAADSPLTDVEIDTNIWIDDRGVLKSFSFEGRTIDGLLQGVIVPEAGGDPEGWIPIDPNSKALYRQRVELAWRDPSGTSRFKSVEVGEGGIGWQGRLYGASHYRPAPKGPAVWQKGDTFPKCGKG